MEIRMNIEDNVLARNVNQFWLNSHKVQTWNLNICIIHIMIDIIESNCQNHFIKYANNLQPKFNFLKPHNTRCVAWLTNFLNRTADDNVILTNYLDSKSLCFRHNAKYLCLYIIIRNSHQYFEARESPLSPLTALAFRLMPLQ